VYTLHLRWSTALNEHDNGFGLWTFNVLQDIVICIKAKFVFNDCLQLISHNDLPMWWHLNGLSLLLFILCWMWSSKVEAQTENVGRPALILHLTTAVHKRGCRTSLHYIVEFSWDVFWMRLKAFLNIMVMGLQI
jgi:hypothetical protein